jgi:UDP-N-acetylmuramate--alanine ligase
VIHSAAIKSDNVELLEAKKRDMLILSRKDSLPFILKDQKIFAVAGAHGKSTTSAMLASIVDGSFLIGAESKQFGSNMNYKDSQNLVFEADESDSSFLNITPEVAIVINAEPEHMEHYDHNLDRFYDAYKTFIKKSKVRVINAEDEFLGSLSDIEAIRLYPSQDIKEIKSIIKNGEPYTSFVLKDLGTFEVYGVGEHIAVNASLAILAAMTRYSLEEIRSRLKDYRGIKKRFDVIERDNSHVIIDDYAHHPTEIEATIKSARKYAKLLGLKKITAIWQPHKYSRTIDNLDRFKECFAGVDDLVILPVFSAGEKEVKIDFQKHFGKYEPIFADKIKKENFDLHVIKDEKDIATLSEGLVIGLGAGDITYMIRGNI